MEVTRQPDSEVQKRRRKSCAVSHWLEPEPKPLDELLPIMLGILEAIAKLNAKGDQFCNLNPSKILVREDGSVQIATQKPVALDKTFNLGSAKYTCPEAFGDAAPGNPESANAYLAAFVFYELLLGRKLFDAQFSAVERDGHVGWLTWHADITKRAVSLSETNRYPAFLCRVIDRMMEKNPTNRLTDMNGVAQLLGSVSSATQVYRIVRDPIQPAPASLVAVKHNGELRPWLATLGQQRLWKSLWKRVAPNEPHLRQGSVQELERMFQGAEGKLRKIGSFFNFGQPGRQKKSG